eukprot:16057-Pleurochrysis_carterae.AAC.1
MAGFVESPVKAPLLKKPSMHCASIAASVLPVLGSVENTHVKGMPCPKPVWPAQILLACMPAIAMQNVARAATRLLWKKRGM